MKADITSGGTGIHEPESIALSVENYSRQRPELARILKAFQPVLEKRASLASSFIHELVDLTSLDTARLTSKGQSIPLLSGMSLKFLAPHIDLSAETMLPLLEAAMPQGRAFRVIGEAMKGNTLDLENLWTSYLNKNQSAMEEAGGHMNIEPEILHFALGQILAPAVSATAAVMKKSIPEISWTKGYCPICGSFPAIAALSKPEPVDLDSLVGGGGKKYLHCSLCGYAWHFRRDACPCCENSEPGTREIMHVRKAGQERIEACTKCKAYFPCIDLREYSDGPDMWVAPLGLIHLNLVAARKGYRPLAPAPWNTFEAPQKSGLKRQGQKSKKTQG